MKLHLTPLFFNMLKIASWNVKGVCDSLRQDEVKKFINSNNISIFGMIETQLRKKFVNDVFNEVFDGWSWASNTVDSPKGCRIAVGWDSRVVGATLLSQSSQVMHFMVKDGSDNMISFVSFIYGSNFVKERLLLWKNLSEHKGVVGDIKMRTLIVLMLRVGLVFRNSKFVWIVWIWVILT